MTEVRWPRGWAQTFYAKIQKHKDAILSGRMLCIDPATGATSDPGYALCVAGVVVASGTVSGLTGQTHERLVQLFWRLHDDERFHDLDVVAIEMLRGKMVAAQLHWSVGSILSALPVEVVCEVPIAVWRACAACDPTYAKGDEADARAIAAAVLALARGEGPDGTMGRSVDPSTGAARAARRQRRQRSTARGAGGVRKPARGGRRKPGRGSARAKRSERGGRAE